MRAALVTQLLALAHETASAATITVAYAPAERWLLVSEPKTTALVLDALMRESPKLPLITKLARGVLDARSHGRWHTTQENAVALVALKRYLDTYEAAVPAFTGQLWLGGAGYAEHPFAGRTTERATARASWASLPSPGSGRPHDLVFAKAGAGRMYYRVGITYAPARTDVPALDAGFIVHRSYEALDARRPPARRTRGRERPPRHRRAQRGAHR